jgi:hypothetical protein
MTLKLGRAPRGRVAEPLTARADHLAATFGAQACVRVPAVPRFMVPTLAALLAAAATAGLAAADHSARPDGRHDGFQARPYSIGLWGDLPYSDVQTTTGVPNLVADMNAQRLAFTANDGDIKSGSSPCTDDVYVAFKATLNSLQAPAAFTPGDNDWTDCDRGPFNSAERLDFERKTFFSTPFTLGQRRLRQEVQGAPYVENRRWTYGGVTYAMLNVQGSCDNLCDVAPDPARARRAHQGQHRVAAPDLRRRKGPRLGRGHADLPGRPGLGPVRSDARAAARSQNARAD